MALQCTVFLAAVWHLQEKVHRKVIQLLRLRYYSHKAVRVSEPKLLK
jgi:hypothetical protein